MGGTRAKARIYYFDAVFCADINVLIIARVDHIAIVYRGLRVCKVSIYSLTTCAKQKNCALTAPCTLSK